MFINKPYYSIPFLQYNYDIMQNNQWHGSADLLATTRANCLLIVREDAEKLAVGQPVDVILLD